MYAAGMMYSPDHTTKMMMASAAPQSVASAGRPMSHPPPPLGSPLSVSAAASAGAAMAAANGLMSASGGAGRYSPTYRVPDQMRDPMRRCMTNPPVSETNMLTSSKKFKQKFYSASSYCCEDVNT